MGVTVTAPYLRQLRRHPNWTQAAVARRIDVTNYTVARRNRGGVRIPEVDARLIRSVAADPTLPRGSER
jgi:transcriptional regulator with XRE-family HTH domain